MPIIEKKIESLDDLIKHLTDPNEKYLQFSTKAESVSPQIISTKSADLSSPRPSVQNQSSASLGPRTTASLPSIGNGTLNSLIRTMGGDLEAIRSGQKPQGIEVKRTVSNVSIIEPNKNTKDSNKLSQSQETVEKDSDQNTTVESKERGSRFLGIFPGIRTPRNIGRNNNESNQEGDKSGGKMPRSLSLPFKINKRAIIIILAGLALVGGTYATFSVIVNKEPEVEIVTFTPRPSKTPIKNDLDSILGNISSIDYKITDRATVNDFHTLVNGQVINELKFRKINFTFENNTAQKPVLADIFKAFSVIYPGQLSNVIGSDFKFLIFGQKEVFSQTVPSPSESVAREKRMVVIVEVTNLSTAVQVLSNWEKTIISDLSGILKIDSSNGNTFSDNMYKDVKIRFNNFILPDKSLDYAIVPASNKKNYIVISNSRESMYSSIDLLRGL